MTQSDDFANEEWRPVAGYESVYEISDIGRVKRVDGRQGTRAGRIRKSHLQKAGYLAIALNRNQGYKIFYIHRLVAEAFLGVRPHGMDINHKNGHKLDNAPANLEYITHTANMRHAHQNGLLKVGSQRPSSKLNEMLVRVIKLNLRHETPSMVGRWFGIPPSTVGNIHRETCWKHVTV